MANPQKENGHIDIAHEIAEALMKTRLSPNQYRLLWVIWRKTWGWHKKGDWISNSQFVEMTGISKGHVARAIQELCLRNIVTRSGNKISFNKDYTQWRELPQGVRGYQVSNSGNSVANSGNSVTPSGNEVTRTGVHKRNSSNLSLQKKVIQKKNGAAVSSPSDWGNGGMPSPRKETALPFPIRWNEFAYHLSLKKPFLYALIAKLESINDEPNGSTTFTGDKNTVKNLSLLRNDLQDAVDAYFDNSREIYFKVLHEKTSQKERANGRVY